MKIENQNWKQKLEGKAFNFKKSYNLKPQGEQTFFEKRKLDGEIGKKGQ